MEYVKEVGMWIELYCVEMFKMYLVIRYFFGGKLRWERNDKTYLLHIFIIIEIFIVTWFSDMQFHQIKVIIPTSILFYMLRFKNIFLSTLGYLLITLIDYVIGLTFIWIFEGNYQEAYHSNLYSITVSTVGLVVVLCFSIYRSRKMSQKNGELYKQEIMIVNCLLIGVLACGVPILSMLFQTNKIQRRGQVIIGIILIFVVFTLIYKRYHRMRLDNESYENKIRLQKKLLAQQKEYYQLMLDKGRETRKIRHDIKSHLYCIRQFEEKKEYQKLHEYIEGILPRVQSFISIISTGNEIIDIVVNNLMQGREVKLDWEGLCPNELKMEQSDLCVLISNLLKNALEATEQTKEKEIQVQVKEYDNDLILNVKNPVIKKVDMIEGKLKTTKKDKDNHGFGLENIQDVIRKYKGRVQYQSEDDTFKVKIFLPNIIL